MVSEFQKAYSPKALDNFDRIFKNQGDVEHCEECGTKGEGPKLGGIGLLCPKCGLYWQYTGNFDKETGEDPY